MFQPLDGPSLQNKITINSSTVTEIKIGSDALSERQAITLQPNGNIKVYFGDGTTTPSSSTVQTNGLNHFKNAKETYEAGESQKVYMLSISGNVDVIVVERS